MKPYTGDRALKLSVNPLSSRINSTVGDCAFCLQSNKKLGNVYRSRRRERGDNYHWDTGELNLSIRMVQIACFIIIATSTGMRLSELLALKPECVINR